MVVGGTQSQNLARNRSMVSFVWLPVIGCVGCVAGFLTNSFLSQGKFNDLYWEVSELHQKISKRDEIIDDMAVTLKNIVLVFTNEHYSAEQKLDMLMKVDKITAMKAAYFGMR
ncbi:hypothetical protein AQZ49_15080 [Novosphingobium sp. FSW06-99]|nr:hypothetical protein AQZ49_15080 [Novosphingobium sp. FSW06-99]